MSSKTFRHAIFFVLAALVFIGAAFPPSLAVAADAGKSLEEFATIQASQGITTLPDRSYLRSLTHHIDRAADRIDMAMFLFKHSKKKGNLPALIINRLIAAKKRGVKVNVLLERSGYDQELNRENETTGEVLAKNGITVLFDGKNRTNHSKLVVIDQRYCFIGSHNLTHSALGRNNEFSLLIDSRELAAELLAYIAKLSQ